MTRSEKTMTAQQPRWYYKANGKGKFNVFHHDEEILKRHPDLVGKIQDGQVLTGVTEDEAKAHVAMATASEAERDAKQALVKDLFSKEHWKMPTRKFITDDSHKAAAVHDALCFFCGGAELRVNNNGTITVQSKGYFHYIGA